MSCAKLQELLFTVYLQSRAKLGYLFMTRTFAGYNGCAMWWVCSGEVIALVIQNGRDMRCTVGAENQQ